MRGSSFGRKAAQVAGLLFALQTAGCGRDPYAGKIPIRYMAWGSPEQLALEEKFCEEFNSLNPDIHVKFVKVPGSAYANKAMVMLATHTAPDVLRIDHYSFPSLVRKGFFYDLTKLAFEDKTFRYSDFFPMTMEEGRYHGGFYGLNQAFGAEIMYYNKTMVQKAGLADPYDLYLKGSWTWAEFRRYACAMTKRDSGGRPLQFGCSVPIFPMNVPVIWGFGGEILTADGLHSRLGEAGAVRAYQFLADLIWRDHCAPTPAQGSNSAFNFESGQLGMALDWMGLTPRYRKAIRSFNWDICPLPKGDSIIKGNQLVVYKESPHPQAAWRFTRFLTSPEVENELYVRRRRNFPTRKSVAFSPTFLRTTLPPFNTRAYLLAAEHSRPLPIGPRWGEWTICVKNAQDSLFSGKVRDAQSAMAVAAANIDAVLADEEGF